jgi:hypothetical protein
MSQLIHRALKICLILVAVAGAPAQAQTPDNTEFRQALEQARTLIAEGARELLDDELMLTAEEKEKFWIVYNRYDAESDKLTTRYLDLADRFVTLHYSYDLTDEDANKLLDEYLEIQIAILQVRQRYLQQFRRVLPGIKVARFYQIENKIRADVDAVLALVVPLADPS